MAEVFGTELVKEKEYTFLSGAKIAVFTWQGATIELRGKAEGCYVAKETPMVCLLFTSYHYLSLLWISIKVEIFPLS